MLPQTSFYHYLQFQDLRQKIQLSECCFKMRKRHLSGVGGTVSVYASRLAATDSNRDAPEIGVGVGHLFGKSMIWRMLRLCDYSAG